MDATDNDRRRAEILGRIRRSLGAGVGDGPRRRAAAACLAGNVREAAIVPARARGTPSELIARFSDFAQKADSVVHRLPRAAAVPGAVAGILHSHDLPMIIRHGTDKALAGLPWDLEPLLVHECMAGDRGEFAALSRAVVAVAEAGTLVMASGPDNPASLNILAHTHLVVVFADDVVGSFEEVFERLPDAAGTPVLPRALTMITGPSRSADIEQTLQLGAHGPLRLHILIVER